MQALNRANPATCRRAQASASVATSSPVSVPRVLCNTQPCILLGNPLTASPSARCSIVARSKLGDVSLFGGDTASLLGGASVEDTKSKPKLDDVPLESEVGMDYTALRDFLKEGDFRNAEDETRALLIRLAGDDAKKRGWVYFTEVITISVKDMLTIDNLWKTASNGKFGYSVQKEIFNQNQKRWGKFFKQIDWTQGENNVYRKWPAEFNYSLDAPRGHLPLTSALRGTQLFEAIMKHPAWEKQQSSKKSIDDSAKEAGANTLKF